MRRIGEAGRQGWVLSGWQAAEKCLQAVPQGRCAPWLKPRVYIGFVAAGLMSELPIRIGTGAAPTPKADPSPAKNAGIRMTRGRENKRRPDNKL